MQCSSGPLRRQLCTFVLFALQPILRASLPACPQTAAACGSCADKVGRRRRRRRSANSVQQDGGRPGCPPFAAAPCTLALQCWRDKKYTNPPTQRLLCILPIFWPTCTGSYNFSSIANGFWQISTRHTPGLSRGFVLVKS